LLPIANAFQYGEARLHLRMIARDQRPLATDARGIWDSAEAAEQIDRFL